MANMQILHIEAILVISAGDTVYNSLAQIFPQEQRNSSFRTLSRRATSVDFNVTSQKFIDVI